MRYEFVLSERVDDEVLTGVFPELHRSTVDLGHRGAVLFGRVSDAPHLRGILDRCEDLGLTVLEMRRLPD